MVITEDILEQGLSSNGGWSNKQLKALGLPKQYFKRDGGLLKGWRRFLVGLDVPEEYIVRFLELKNAHLSFAAKTKRLFA